MQNPEAASGNRRRACSKGGARLKKPWLNTSASIMGHKCSPPTMTTNERSMTMRSSVSRVHRSVLLIAALVLCALLSATLMAVPTANAGETDGSANWAYRAGGAVVPPTGSVVDVDRGMAFDQDGNLYSTGTFAGSATFEGAGGTIVPVTSAGSPDIFVRKYDPDGALLWVRRFGGVGADYGLAANDGPNGDVVVCGAFSRTVAFDATVLTTTLTSVVEPFVARLSPSGSVLWAKKLAAVNGTPVPGGPYGAPQVVASECAFDPAGNILVSGSVQAVPARFNADGPSPVDVTPLGTGADGFIVKLDTAGNFVWVAATDGQTANGSNYVRALEVAGDGADVLTGGRIQGTTSFGSTTLTAVGGFDAWFAKIDGDTGAWLWVKAIAGTGNDESRGIAAAGDDIVLGGKYTTSAGLVGPDGVIAPNVLTSNGSIDAFVAKLSSDGDLIWATTLGGPNPDEGTEVAVDPQGRVFCGGYYIGSVTLGPTGGGGPTATAVTPPPPPPAIPAMDFLLALLDGSTGSGLWVSQAAGGQFQDSDYGVDADRFGNYGFGGFFVGTASFGATTLVSAGSDDAVVGKIADIDEDGVLNGADECLLEDATGFDADNDGCIDRIGDLHALFDTLYSEGAIDATMWNSLNAKIDAAIASTTRDNVCAAVNQLDALQNQLEAQTGKKVSEDAAALLLPFIDNVQAYMMIATGIDSCS